MQEIFHQYNLMRELARKYSHTTYLASPINPQSGHGEPERQVVLTVFSSSLFYFPRECENLLQKVQRIKGLQHPHLLPILDLGIENEQPFIVREYLPNGSLRSHLKKISPDRLELREALTIVLQVGQALAYAHRHSILHGNLKPENVLLGANGQVFLADFYLVDRKDAIIRDQATEKYAFCYMAPEQFVGSYDARGDQYALGCLAYELITGQVPFAAQSLSSLMGEYNHTLPAPLSESVPDLSPALEAAVFKALAKDPNERFFDFSLFLEVIQSVLSPPPAFPLAHAPHSRRNRTISHPIPLAKVAGVSSPIDKRATQHIAQLPEPLEVSSHAQGNIAELATVPSRVNASVREQEEIVCPPVAIQSHVVESSPSQHMDSPSEREYDSPYQPLKRQTDRQSSVITVEALLQSEDPPSALTRSTPIIEEGTDPMWLTDFLEEEEVDEPLGTGPFGDSAVDEQNESEIDRISLSLTSSTDVLRPRALQAPRSRRMLLTRVFPLSVILALFAYAFWPSGIFTPGPSLHPTHPRIHSTALPVFAQVPSQKAYPAPNPTPSLKDSRIDNYPNSPIGQTAAAEQSISRTSLTAQPSVVVVNNPTAIPTAIPEMTPTATPSITQTTTIDDSVVGAGTNQFDYVGTDWSHCTNCGSELYDGTNSWDKTSNDYVTLTFTGVQIKFYGVLDSKHGIGAVSVDGGNETMIDCYAPTRAGDQLMWTSPMLSTGTHTFELRITGNKNPNSSNISVPVDRVDILS